MKAIGRKGYVRVAINLGRYDQIGYQDRGMGTHPRLHHSHVPPTWNMGQSPHSHLLEFKPKQSLLELEQLVIQVNNL